MLRSILDWMDTPLGTAASVYLFGGVFSLVFKRKSPQAYAALAARHPVWFFARAAAFIEWVGGWALDPRQVARATVKVITGKVTPLEAFQGMMTEEERQAVTVPPPASKGGSITVFFPLVAGLSLSALVAGSVSGCTLAQREDAKTALDVVQVACLIAHQALPDSDVAKICGITTPFIGPMQTILASTRAASAQAAAGARAAGGCGQATAKDGGAP